MIEMKMNYHLKLGNGDLSEFIVFHNSSVK